MNNFIIFIILTSAYFAVSFADRWHYPAEEPNGVVKNKEEWGGDCDSGTNQSPVDLNEHASVVGNFPPFILSSAYYTPMHKPEVFNTGHSIQINNIYNPEAYTIQGGGLPGVYVFDQMHFHWAAEHTINGKRSAVELHLVHHDQKYDNISHASTHANGIAVLGVLFRVSHRHSLPLENILRSAKVMNATAGSSQLLEAKLYINELLPKKLDKYFRYEGSLTTPNCGEAVVWTIFEELRDVSVEQIKHLKKLIETEHGKSLTHNYRTLQPLNSRVLVYISPDYEYFALTGVGSKSCISTAVILLLALELILAFTKY